MATLKTVQLTSIQKKEKRKNNYILVKKSFKNIGKTKVLFKILIAIWRFHLNHGDNIFVVCVTGVMSWRKRKTANFEKQRMTSFPEKKEKKYFSSDVAREKEGREKETLSLSKKKKNVWTQKGEIVANASAIMLFGNFFIFF